MGAYEVGMEVVAAVVGHGAWGGGGDRVDAAET